MFDFNQRVYLRRDPSQWGYVGNFHDGTVIDEATQTVFVFWEHDGGDIQTCTLVEDLMDGQEYAAMLTMERLYDAVQSALDKREDRA